MMLVMILGTACGQIASAAIGWDSAKQRARRNCDAAGRLTQYSDVLNKQIKDVSSRASLDDSILQEALQISQAAKQLATSLKRDDDAFKRHVVLMVIAEALVTVIVIFLLIRSKERRDAILNYL